MERDNNEFASVESEIRDSLVRICIIPDIPEDMSLETVIYNEEIALQSLIACADFMQRRIYIMQEEENTPEGHIGTLMLRTSMLGTEIGSLRHKQERLLISEALIRACRGEVQPREVQIMVEGSHLLEEIDKSEVLNILTSYSDYELQSSDDPEYAFDLLRYRSEHGLIEPSRYGNYLRRDIATTMVAFFFDTYEGIELYDDLCSVVREATIVQRLGLNLQGPNPYIGLVMNTAQNLGIEQSIVDNLVNVILTDEEGIGL